MANEYSKETKVRIQSENAPHFSKVSKVSVVSGGTGGGEGEYDGTISWDNVTGKPDQFAPSPHDHDERYSQIDHNHDDRYNTKEQVSAEIDFVRQQMVAGQGRVSATSTDVPGFLESKVDNTTVKVEGSELVVKSMDGLTVGAADISTWLAGTSDNVQTQIDDAVAKRHEHSNKESLDKITVNNDGDLVVDGKVIELKPPELPEKEFVYANARSEAYSSGTLWKWHHRTGNISFDTNGGILLKAGKSYKIDINVSFGSNFDSWKVFGFVDAETGELAPEAPTANMALMKESSTYTEAHSRTLSLIMTPQTTRRFGVTITSGASPTTNATMYSRSSITIVEI